MHFDFGDVVLVSFPFTSQLASKKRPAVIVSGSTYNRTKPDVVIMAITSQIHAGGSCGETIISNWQAANLLKPSAIKPILATIEQRLIQRHLGRMQASDQTALRASIKAILEI